MERQSLSRLNSSLYVRETLGELMRKLREGKNLTLRKGAFKLDVDQSSLSKIERGERLPAKKLLPRIASVFELEEKDVLISYLGDKLMYILLEYEEQEEILKAAEEKLKYIRYKRAHQGELKL